MTRALISFLLLVMISPTWAEESPALKHPRVTHSLASKDPALVENLRKALESIGYRSDILLGVYDFERLDADHFVSIRPEGDRVSYFIRGHGISGVRKTLSREAVLLEIVGANSIFNLTDALHLLKVPDAPE